MKNKTFIIAEAGVNHNGSIRIAKKLIDAAKSAGADAIKFQTFKAEKLVTKDAAKADYQKRTTATDETQYKMLKKLELSENDHKELFNYCKRKRITFISSPFDEESVDILNNLGIEIFKIPSGEITNLPILKHISRIGKEMILSTGMSNLGEVETAVDCIYKEGNKKLTLLHCVTEYPAPYLEINLKAMLTLKNAFNLPVGYSDHTKGIEISLAAVALGAQVIEKHFTLDRNMEGPDHKASLEPNELRMMINAIRNIEKAIGDGIKRPAKCEIKNLKVARKSIVVKKALKVGDKITINHLTLKRSGSGIEPKFFEILIGRTVNKDLKIDSVINWSDLT